MYNTHYHLSYSLLPVDRTTADKYGSSALFSGSDLVKKNLWIFDESINRPYILASTDSINPHTVSKKKK